jgi:hypothetical protein
MKIYSYQNCMMAMNNLKKHCETIQQAPNNGVESTNCKAVKFDDGFTKADCVVDYIDIIENGLIMIEMKDLQLLILKNFKGKPGKEELKEVFKNIITKFTNAFNLITKEINPDLIKVSNYLVWKNNTDTVFMDKYLPREFKDRPYQICKTNEICDRLKGLNIRICQK